MSNPRIRTIFMGTPEFAVKPLLSLIADNSFEIVAVFTNPDEKVGRKQTLSEPPVKKIAIKNGLPCYQPQKIRTETDLIKKLSPDLIVVVAYGHLIPQEILDIPRYACINLHASLLPKYRGASCLQAPILNGDKTTGLTIMKMEAGLDTGPILEQVEIELAPEENLESLRSKLGDLGGKIITRTLKDYIAGKIKERKQEEAGASYVKITKKEDGKINFAKAAADIEKMVRAFYPWPTAWFELAGPDGQNRKIQILKADTEIIKGRFTEPGQFFKHQKQLGLQCEQDALAITSLKIEGKNPITGQAFMNGYKNLIK